MINVLHHLSVKDVNKALLKARGVDVKEGKNLSKQLKFILNVTNQFLPSSFLLRDIRKTGTKV